MGKIIIRSILLSVSDLDYLWLLARVNQPSGASRPSLSKEIGRAIATYSPEYNNRPEYADRFNERRALKKSAQRIARKERTVDLDPTAVPPSFIEFDPEHIMWLRRAAYLDGHTTDGNIREAIALMIAAEIHSMPGVFFLRLLRAMQAVQARGTVAETELDN